VDFELFFARTHRGINYDQPEVQREINHPEMKSMMLTRRRAMAMN